MRTPIIFIIFLLLIKIITKKYPGLFKGRKITPKKPLTSEWQKKLYTVYVFTRLSTKRFFRDRLAIFFSVLFPLIFLFVFGALTNHNNKVSFSVALINKSNSSYSKEVVKAIKSSKIFKVDQSITNLSQAKEKMSKNQLDSAIELPANFGQIKPGPKIPIPTMVKPKRPEKV